MSLNLIITDAGRAALVNADNTGTQPVQISHIGISSAMFQPLPDQTTLPGEIKRLQTFGGEVVADDVIHLTITDDTNAVYSLGSFALYTNTGILFAVYSQATPILQKHSGGMMLLSVDVKLTSLNPENIQFGGTEFILPPGTETTHGLLKLTTAAEATAGAENSKAMTALRVWQALAAWWAVSAQKIKLDGIQAGAQVNRPFGTTAGTTCQGNDSRLSDSREWSAATVTQAEAEAGSATTRRAWTAQRVRQAISSATAAAALQLATARTINGVPFDGSANIIITAAPTAHNHSADDITSGILPIARGGTGRTDGKAVALITARTINGVPFDGSANINISAAPTAHNHSADDLTSGTLPIARGGTGRSDGRAAALATARSISASGDVTWTISFDGSGNVTGTATLDDIFKGKTAGSTTQDPNLATDVVILTNHANSPGQGKYWHITTTFYSSISATGNRSQIAIQYNNAAEPTQCYVRHCYQQTWSAWMRCDNNGTSAAATKLATARTINGVAFDGSANITISANPNSHTHSASDITSGTLITARGGTGRTDGKAVALATARTINGVAFDGSANISISAPANGGTSAACSGNAATATRLATARTINGVAFNGSANITLPFPIVSSANAVGSYAALGFTVSGSDRLPNQTFAGSQLRYASFGSQWPSGGGPSVGTWRIHGVARYGGSGQDDASIFLRIS